MTRTPPPEKLNDPDLNEGAIIAEAVGLTWAHFKARHPAQAAGILRSLGGKPIVPEIIAVLENDDAYAGLLEVTAAEADAARVVAVIGPLVLDALFTILAA